MARRKFPRHEEYGGHSDYEFVETVPDNFTCSICTKVLRDPHLTACCGQHYCESCLDLWSNSQGGRSCPHCREEYFHHILNKERKREIEELKVRCTLRQEGCQWMGELKSLMTHLNSDRGCGYVEVSCTNDCELRMKRKSLKRHLAEECLLREYKCVYCGHEDTYQAITGDIGASFVTLCRNHYDKCPNFPLDCPNRCGGTAIPRKDMSDHRANCPLEPVECPFKEAGCEARLVRSALNEHINAGIQQHLLLVMEDSRKLKAQMRELQLMKKGIKANVKQLLESSCTGPERYPLQSIQSILDEAHHLKEPTEERGSCNLEFVAHMDNFSWYEQNGKTWHSPPFYYGAGYKMCLAVQVVRSVFRATLVSVTLMLLKGEFDNELPWPINSSRSFLIVCAVPPGTQIPIAFRLSLDPHVHCLQCCTPGSEEYRILKTEERHFRIGEIDSTARDMLTASVTLQLVSE